jgi:predicted nucleotidyltransferase
MATKLQAPTRTDAEKLADDLVRKFPAIDSVLLCGSVARGDANPYSDIDLVVTSSDANLNIADLRVALGDLRETVSLIFFRTDELRKQYEQGVLFIGHLIKEGIPLYDRHGNLKALFEQPFVPAPHLDQEIALHRARLDRYRHPERYNNNFLFPLAHLYAIGKSVVILGLAKRGVLEFNREAAFRRFAHLHPDLAEQVDAVTRLRPFFSLVNNRSPQPLPFPFYGADKQMREAVNAIDSLAERAACQ